METSNLDAGIDRIELLITGLVQKLVDIIPELIKAVVLLVVGLFLIRTALKLIKKRFEARNVDLSLRGFLLSIIKFILYAMLILSVVQALGFQTTAILGALSGLVLAAGLALQGSLSNFAGGVLILLFRPFEVGDYIENSAGAEGTVERIDLLYTSLRNSNGIAVFSPNGALANSVIRNFSKITKRRFEYTIGVSYDDNIKEIKSVIEKTLLEDSRILKDPKPEIFVKELATTGINLTVRAWTVKENFTGAHTELQENINKAIADNGFKNPYAPNPIRIIDERTE